MIRNNFYENNKKLPDKNGPFYEKKLSLNDVPVH